jgi:hypothetical protein
LVIPPFRRVVAHTFLMLTNRVSVVVPEDVVRLEVAREAAQLLEEGVIDRNAAGLAGLGPGDADHAVLHVHTVPGEPEDLPAAHPGVERADHDGSEMRRTGREESLDLLRRQITNAALWLRQLLHPQDGVRR